jgi:Fic family protein
MGSLELFLHEDRPALPLFIKAGLAHVQFETIHHSLMETAGSGGC